MALNCGIVGLPIFHHRSLRLRQKIEFVFGGVGVDDDVLCTPIDLSLSIFFSWC